MTATPKLRSRNDGAAIPLDDLDRKLLNLLQGSFPLNPRPYGTVARLAGITEEQAIARTDELLRARIIRQVTPIYDTRALGYASMLVAAKVDSEHPWRVAQIVNEHPGVSHNYLRNHEFNMWFTIAVERDSRLGLEGTLEVLAELTGAVSIRQLPTLKLFKIRMDLEMEGDTKALASAGQEADPAPLSEVPYDELDIAVIRATQGDMPIVAEPYAAAAARLAMPVAEPPRPHGGHARARSAAPRRRDPLPPPRGLLRERHGGLERAGGADRGARTAHGLLPWDLPLLPAPDLRGLAVLRLHDGARPLEGGVRRDPRLDRGGHGDRRARDALLLDRVQEGPPALLHRRVPRVGGRSRLSAPVPAGIGIEERLNARRARSRAEELRGARPTEAAIVPAVNDTHSMALYERARAVLPGGVNSPVRAMRAIGRDPIFIDRARRRADH